MPDNTCTPSHPCIGAVVEDLVFQKQTGRRMVRCGNGHTLYVEPPPPPPPRGSAKCCQFCGTPITTTRTVYCSAECSRLAQLEQAAELNATIKKSRAS